MQRQWNEHVLADSLQVDKYKDLLEQERARQAREPNTAEVLQKELETLVTSKKQLQSENDSLRTTTTDMLAQLKSTEQGVAERFTQELKALAEQLQKETGKTTSLTTLVNSLKNDESSIKKELEKLKNENRLLSVKYNNQTSEHAAAFTVGSRRL